MGNKMTWETARRLTEMKPEESVWNENNPYGYDHSMSSTSKSMADSPSLIGNGSPLKQWS